MTGRSTFLDTLVKKYFSVRYLVGFSLEVQRGCIVPSSISVKIFRVVSFRATEEGVFVHRGVMGIGETIWCRVLRSPDRGALPVRLHDSRYGCLNGFSLIRGLEEFRDRIERPKIQAPV